MLLLTTDAVKYVQKILFQKHHADNKKHIYEIQKAIKLKKRTTWTAVLKSRPMNCNDCKYSNQAHAMNKTTKIIAALIHSHTAKSEQHKIKPVWW